MSTAVLCVWQAEQRRGVPAAGARRGGHGGVAGGAARAHGRARAALAHAARARQPGAQAPLLLHAQEEVSLAPYLPIRPVARMPHDSHDAPTCVFEPIRVDVRSRSVRSRSIRSEMSETF